MKKYLPIYLLLFFLLAFKNDDPKSQYKLGKFVLPKGVTAQDYLPNTLIVKFKKAGNQQVNSIGLTAKKQLAISGAVLTNLTRLFPETIATKETLGLDESTLPDLNEIYIAHYEGKQDIVTVINVLLQDEQIAYIEPSYIYRTSFVPNDPSFGEQNYLTQVKAPQAWDILKNSSNVIIAIVDSGSDLQHEDLAANIYLNTADPINGIDDDGDGYIDNYYGWDFVGKSATTMIGDNDPDIKGGSDHGVHVSGIASAVSNNGIGVASIAYNAKLMIVKAGADEGGAFIYKGYESIKYAADHGANIINCSWGGPGGGQFGQDMIDYAVAKNCLVIAAAGNSSTDAPSYPAAYNNVLSVANVNGADVKSPPSNYGYSIDISAPGNGIYNTLNNNSYGVYSGTSMASPMVASAAALVKAKYPSYTGLQIGELLRATADPIDNLNLAYAGKLGKGRLNVYNALTQSPSSVRYQKINVADQSNGSRAAGTELTLTLDLKSFLAPVAGLNLNISSASPYIQVIDQNMSVGNLGTLENKTNIGPIRIKILANTPQNEVAALKLTYTGNAGAYVDSEQFNITIALDYLNVTVNKVSTTLTSNGRVGFSKAEGAGGLGFIYKDESMLYEASLMIGKSSIQVSNNARSTNGSTSEDFFNETNAQKVLGTQADFEGQSVFSDLKGAYPIGVRVKSTILAYSTAPNDKYVLVGYEITNTNTTNLTGIYTGLLTDWDLDEASANATKYDAPTRTGYAYSKHNASYPYAGVRLLTTAAPPAYFPMTYQLLNDPLADNTFTIFEKYQTLINGIKSVGLGYDTADGYDILFVIGSGPYTIPANGSIKVAYAFLGGDNLAELLNNGAAAQAKFATSSLNTTVTNPISLVFALKQNYPNPTQTNTTTIPFTLAEKAATTLTLTNIQGKVIKKLVDQTLEPGNYTIPVDLSAIGAGLYFYQLTSGTHKETLKMIVAK